MIPSSKLEKANVIDALFFYLRETTFRIQQLKNNFSPK